MYSNNFNEVENTYEVKILDQIDQLCKKFITITELNNGNVLYLCKIVAAPQFKVNFEKELNDMNN